jgi:4-hydroxythreonine-4-phosphate dehydrogenase
MILQCIRPMRHPIILITPGDPAGIGPEVIQKALASTALPQNCEFELLPYDSTIITGKPSEASARIALDCLETAARRLREGSADAVVTGPVCKESLQALGFPFPGQTEFFCDRLHAEDVTMCLTGDHLTVALVTIHIPLAEVSAALQPTAIIKSGTHLADYLRQRLKRQPRIAVCGLNPHAGENGAFGREEIETITPAIDELNRSGRAEFSGPHVPDAIFRDAARGRYDAVLCMYHDQGLIPLKLLDFDNAVNISLGLPRPRLSPDHGTAFDIAGKNIADHSSMLRALQRAAEMVATPEDL